MAQAVDRRAGGRRAGDPGFVDPERAAADFERMRRSLLSLWADLAASSEGASASQLEGACSACFPEPRGAVFNNALLDRGCADAPATIEMLGAHYADSSVTDFAIWAHESEQASLEALESARYVRSEATRAMLVHLDEVEPSRSRGSRGRFSIATTHAPGEALELNGLALDTFDAWPDDALWYLAHDEETLLSCALTRDCDGDRSISCMATAEPHRRRGIAGRLLDRVLADARAAGCTTASLHATPVAEDIYRHAGFCDLGLLIEHRRPR